jgi:hypothetical protein
MLDHAVRLLSANAYAMVGAVAAALIPLWLAYMWRIWRRPKVRTLRVKVAEKFGGRRSKELESELNWLPPDPGADRRRALRRAGPPTPIRVAASAQQGPDAPPADEALVLDRATGGLCFAVECPLPAGGEAFLRVEGSGPDFPWVAVCVRHCRDCGEFFLIGCQFRDKLPLNILLQFG